MPQSPTSGFAGSVRVQRLDLAGVAAAEKHGKRLDWSSMQRRVRSVEPLVWPPNDGLDLMALYERHVAGVFVPGGDTKMLHNIVQFPKDLISEDEPERMLEGGIKFMERVYGPESVVAARIDQDEKGRHIVDVFVVPIYDKKTKHTTKRAVSISKHLKDLANEQGLVDSYNQRVEEKRTIQASERADLRASLMQTAVSTQCKEGPYDRSDLTRLFTRHRRNRSGEMASADAGLRGLSLGELVQGPEHGNWQPTLGMLVFGEVGEGVQRNALDRGLRHQDVSAKTRRESAGAIGRAPGVGPVPALAIPKTITDPNLYMQGVALQTALHEFLRDEMELEGVQRGRQKKAIGPDWQTPEMLEIQRQREEVAAKEAAAAAALENSRDLERLASEQTATASKRSAAAAEMLAQAEARQQEVTAKEAAAAEALENSRGLERLASQQTATASKRSAAAAELLAQAEAREAEASTAHRNALALGAGVTAFLAGDVKPVQKDDGTKTMRYRDALTKERLAPVLMPVFEQLWDWMKQMAQAMADRMVELFKAATADRDQAAHDRAGAVAAKLEVDRLMVAARADRELAADTKRKAGDLAVQASTFMAEAMNDRDQAAHNRKLAAVMVTPAARQRAIDAHVTPERVEMAISRHVTSEAVQRAIEAHVTPDLVAKIVSKKVTEAQAVNSTLNAVMAADRQREQGR